MKCSTKKTIRDTLKTTNKQSLDNYCMESTEESGEDESTSGVSFEPERLATSVAEAKCNDLKKKYSVRLKEVLDPIRNFRDYKADPIVKEVLGNYKANPIECKIKRESVIAKESNDCAKSIADSIHDSSFRNPVEKEIVITVKEREPKQDLWESYPEEYRNAYIRSLLDDLDNLFSNYYGASIQNFIEALLAKGYIEDAKKIKLNEKTLLFLKDMLEYSIKNDEFRFNRIITYYLSLGTDFQKELGF